MQHSTSRGKCYGFVTFRSPRSAIDAINDMECRTVDGRVVRVNEVRSRSGFGGERGRESFRRNVERGRSWGSRGREHEMEYDDVRESYRERYNDRSMERGDRYIVRLRERLSVEYDEERDGGYGRGGGDQEMMCEQFSDRDRGRRETKLDWECYQTEILMVLLTKGCKMITTPAKWLVLLPVLLLVCVILPAVGQNWAT